MWRKIRMNIEFHWKVLRKQLKYFLLKRMDDPHDVDDVLQNVFIKMYQNINQLQSEQKFRPWIYQITRNELANYYRSHEKLDELPSSLTENDEPNDEEVIEELSSCIRPMIQKLPSKYKEALELSEIKGIKQKEISDRLGMSYSGVKSRVQRGREKLKQLMLSCCQFEFDRQGYIIDYEMKSDHCAEKCQHDECQ